MIRGDDSIGENMTEMHDGNSSQSEVAEKI